MSLGTRKLAAKALEVMDLVITVVENAMVLGDTKGLLLRLRKEFGPGVDKVRKQQHKQANPSTLKPSSAASRASGGTAPTPAARPSSLLPAA